MAKLREKEQLRNEDFGKDSAWRCDTHPTNHQFLQHAGTTDIIVPETGQKLNKAQVRKVNSGVCPLCP